MRVFLTCTERLFECVFWLHSLNFQMQLWSFDLLHLWWNIKEIGHIGLEITEVNCQQVLIWVNAYTELFWATIQKTVSQSLTFKEFFHMSKFGWSEMFSFFKIQFSVDYRSNRSKSKANHLLLFLIWIMVPFDQEDQRLYSEIAASERLIVGNLWCRKQLTLVGLPKLNWSRVKGQIKEDLKENPRTRRQCTLEHKNIIPVYP